MSLTRNQKGAVAELEVAAAAARLGIPVLGPLHDHCRYDLGLELAGRLWRVQCKWASHDPVAGVIRVNLQSSSRTADGYALRSYTADEIDLVAVYCGDLDRCYLLDGSLVAGRRAIWLRTRPPGNGQIASVTLAVDLEFDGAVAQLEERRAGSAKVRGSSPLSSTRAPTTVGAHEFRGRFGRFLERAAGGERIVVTRRGRPSVQLIAYGGDGAGDAPAVTAPGHLA